LLEDSKVEGLPKKMANTTKQIVVAKVRCFLRTAFRRGRIERPLAEQVTGLAAVYEQKSPFTKQDLTLVLNEARKLNGARGTPAYRKPSSYCSN
jgi:hypothetical protein